MVRKKHLGKADQWTLASGGSEHTELFSVAISWGNKMNFNLCTNMAGLSSDGHILNVILMWLHAWQGRSSAFTPMPDRN